MTGYFVSFVQVFNFIFGEIIFCSEFVGIKMKSPDKTIIIHQFHQMSVGYISIIKTQYQCF